jgi:hypothetical protein
MRTSKPENWSGSPIDRLDRVSPYQQVRDNHLAAPRSAQPGFFGLWDLGFGAPNSLGFTIWDLGFGIWYF